MASTGPSFSSSTIFEGMGHTITAFAAMPTVATIYNMGKDRMCTRIVRFRKCDGANETVAEIERTGLANSRGKQQQMTQNQELRNTHPLGSETAIAMTTRLSAPVIDSYHIFAMNMTSF